MEEQTRWILEGRLDGDGRVWRTVVEQVPFLIGRVEGCDLRLPGAGVSGRHAELVAGDRGLRVRDLGSKNGTFVNRERVEAESGLRAGDVLHFANQEFRLVEESEVDAATATLALDLDVLRSAQSRSFERDDFERMIEEGALGNDYQPVVDLATGEFLGFEALGRGAHPDLPQSPEDLFRMAQGFGLERRLCGALRAAVAAEAPALPAGAALFLNTHPSELLSPQDILPGLESLRRGLPDAPMVLELHELAVTQIETLRPFRSALLDLEIEIAFDDFGKGRDRLLELAELKPRFLKFDRRLVAGLDEADDARRTMIHTLVSMVSDMGVSTIAEGVETDADAAACRSVGFDFAQGYLWGRPQEAAAWA